jgi:hypothetical protein
VPPGEGNSHYRKRLEEFLLVGGECVDCGVFIPKPPRGRLAKYCAMCNIVHIHSMAKINGKKFKEKNPTYNSAYCRLRRNNGEIIVATSCRVCGNIIPYKGIGEIPQRCDICRGIERNKKKPLWNPEDTATFIAVEKQRIGLNSLRRWTKPTIMALERKYETL